MNLLQSACKILFIDTREHEQKLITAVANEHVCLPDAFTDLGRHRDQCDIAGIVTIGIIIELKIIQVNHRDPGRVCAVLDFILIIAAVVCTGQSIQIELLLVAAQLVEQLLPVMRITQYILIHSLNQLHDAGFTINDYVSGSHLINFRIQKFQLGALSLLLKRPKGYTISACLSAFPEVIAPARTHIKLLRLTFSKQLKLFQPYNAYDRKYLLKLLHFLLCLFSGHTIIIH